MNCVNHPETAAVAYCRTCGKALCEECKRDVMGVIYCEPCIAARLQGTMPTASAAAVPPGTPVVAAAPGGPNPVLAVILGVIFPGVGQMYNGQFLKGFVYVLIFASLIWGASEVGEFFGILIPFWILYMAIDAYRTAKARQLGQPVPEDIFGLSRATAEVPGGSATSNGTVGRTAPPIGAIVLIGMGTMFLLHNAGIFRFYWIGRMWPLILVGVGVWMIYQRRERVAGS
jgi:TM2 domain-containing membrane protein YozV